VLSLQQIKMNASSVKLFFPQGKKLHDIFEFTMNSRQKKISKMTIILTIAYAMFPTYGQ